MLSFARWLQVLAICLIGVVCTALPSIHGYPDDSLHYRDEEEAYSSDPEKPVRDDGLGSLLLKNLRFRDLSSEVHNKLRPALMKILANRQHYHESQENSREYKRRDMSVNELAKILNNLKARNVDGGVKLQSLRFGRRR